ncbi:MAG TPA: hypothetical protein VIP77_04675 [Jiangellaceae bacterium]
MPPVDTLVALRRAHVLIDRSYAEPLGLDAIAAAAGYSRHHVVRAFRIGYGETLVRYPSRHPRAAFDQRSMARPSTPREWVEYF